MAQVRSKKATRVPKTRATRTASGASKPRSGPAPSGAGRRPAPYGTGRRRWTMLFAEGNATMRDLLGGKGAGLAEMSRIGLPVPPGFTITTEACLEYYRRSRQFPAGLMDEVRQKMHLLEERTGKRFGDATKPLLVSVRSGAKFSMPGMMDTVLNLGLNKTTVEGLARASGDARFAYDSYRRFMQMFGNVVLGLKHELFEDILLAAKRARGVTQDTELSAGDLGALTEEYRRLVRERAGQAFPEDPWQQLEMAIHAVFESWNNPRAITYRNFNKIPHDLGTAVNVQTMVFGTLGPTSGTGVAFTRDPATGEKKVYGEYLLNAQGEDVVAGIRTPKPIGELVRDLPQAYRQFMDVCALLEKHYRDVQDVEFTIEHGTLYLLQTRSGKRTGQAAVKIAVDMVHEKLITKEEALLRAEPASLEQLLHPRLDPDAPRRVIGKGLAASPGAASGAIVFDADEAVKLATQRKVILARPETNPDDIHGLVAAQGVLTSRGGMTSHAAIVARGMGKPAVVGAESLRIDEEAGQLAAGDVVIHQGDVITIDGSTGEVILGEVPVIEPSLAGEIEELLRWADQVRTLGVRANADYPRDARKALEFGAEGIGLCRTEHMFMEAERLPIMQKMILAAVEVKRDEGIDVIPEVMIPLVGHPNELQFVHQQLVTVAAQIVKEAGVSVRYLFGTMIEIPRACLVADQIAEIAEFFSFGTNDLTQTIFGFSRDDAQAKFLNQYLEKGILTDDPFQVLDRSGVGKLMEMGARLGKKVRADLEVGICGEHGGDPSSVEFCHQIGLDYVSCSPFRVPIARLAAAQARLKEKTATAKDI